MRSGRSLRVVPALVALAILAGAVFSAPEASADDAQIVAKVGSIVITQADLRNRLTRVPRLQLALLGDDDATIKRAFLEKVMIPEILFSEGAKKRGLADKPDVRARVRDTYRTALLAKIREDVTTGLTDADVQKFYEENRARFESKERIQIWRILVESKEDAQKLLEEAKKASPEKWMTLSREKSLDKATHERGGNLGFLDENGQSNEVAVKADPLLFAAAKKVKDGELVNDPVPEGGKWAVVWRRGSTPAVARGVEAEGQGIRQMLVRQRTETIAKDIVATLRKDVVKDVEPTLTSIVEVGKAGEVATRKRTGVTPKAPGKPRPSAVPGQGLRLARNARTRPSEACAKSTGSGESFPIVPPAGQLVSMLAAPWKRPSATPSTPTPTRTGRRSSSAATTTPGSSPRRSASATRSSPSKRSPPACVVARCASSPRQRCLAS
jgi:peptidyl-prolyl cis-trans isomerase C